MSKIRTVLGDIRPEELGYTSVHEHTINNMPLLNKMLKRSAVKMVVGNKSYQNGADIKAESKRRKEMHIDNIPTQSTPQLFVALLLGKKSKLSDLDYYTNELNYYREQGGQAVCDCTPSWMAAPTSQIVELSKRTGVKILINAGFYTATAFERQYLDKDEQFFVDYLEDRIANGDGTSDARPGFLKVALGYLENEDIIPIEQKTLRACAKMQKKYGMSLHIHFSFPIRPDHILKAADIIEEIGVDPHKTIFLHQDTINMGNYSPVAQVNKDGYTLDLPRKLLARGFNIGLDSWTVRSHFPGAIREFEFETRKKMLRDLVQEGYVSQITLGHDFSTSNMGVQLGGCGYLASINALKEMVADGMITEDDVRALTVDNPARILAY